MAVYERLGATYAAAFSRVKVAALLAHLFTMRAYRSFYRRHRTRTLVAMRVLVPISMVGAWLTAQPRPCHIPMKTAALGRLIYGVFLSQGWVVQVETH